MSHPAGGDGPPTVAVSGILASPHRGGATAAALDAFLAGCREAGAATTVVDLNAVELRAAAAALLSADAAVFASPTYRATHTALLAGFLEQVDRGGADADGGPLRGMATAVVMTAGAEEHFLATERLQHILTTFFAAQVLAPPLAFGPGAFDGPGALTAHAGRLAALHGRALVDLAVACRESANIAALAPLA